MDSSAFTAASDATTLSDPEDQHYRVKFCRFQLTLPTAGAAIH